MANMFIASFIASILSLIAVFFTPKGRLITTTKKTILQDPKKYLVK